MNYFPLHRANCSLLAVRLDDGAIYHQLELPGLNTAQTFGDDKNGWECPLMVHEYALRHTSREWKAEWVCRARVLCAIMAAVEDLPESDFVRVVVLESSIRDLAEDTLANLVPESRRPTGSFPVFEALSKVLEAIDICEVHP